MSDFGSGLGAVIGGAMAKDTLNDTQNSVNANTNAFANTVSPNTQFGQSFLPQAQNLMQRADTVSQGTKGYDDFMKDYTASPGAQYTIGQAQEAQNNSAASTGQLLSGTNERALDTITQGVSGTLANQAYSSYLTGNNQQFGQLESLVGNAFTGVNQGLTASGQVAGVVNGQNTATSAIGQASAKADQSKGSGIGSMFSGLGSIATMF